MKIRAASVIWGRPFVEMFLEVGLRSLLAEGNLPALAKRHRVVYTVFTTAQDAELLQQAPAFARLQQQVQVRISLFSPQETAGGQAASHHLFWSRGFELARRNGEILFLLIPDLLFAKGTLLRWAARFEAGYHAVYTPGPQVVLETLLPELRGRFPTGTEALALDDGELQDLLFRHLHPLHASMLRDSPRRVAHPEYDIRPVKGRGFVLREWTANPFCMDPAFFASFTNLSPNDHLGSIATEPCSTVSVEPLFKHHRWYYRPWRLDELRLSQLGQWWDIFGPPGCIEYSGRVQEFCLKDDDEWRAGRARAIAGGRFTRHQLWAATQIYRLIAHLQQSGQHRSAGFVAMALYGASLRRRIAINSGAVLFLPSDAAYELLDDAQLNDLLTPGREQELIDLIRDHIIPSPHEGAPESWLTSRGLPLAPLAQGVCVLSGPTQVGGFEVYLIDEVLLRDSSLRRPQPGLIPGPVCDAGAGEGALEAGQRFVARARPVKTALRALSTRARPSVARVRRLARPFVKAIYLRIASVPYVGPPVRGLRIGYAKLREPGLRQRALARVRSSPLDSVLRSGTRILHLAERGSRIVRERGLAFAWLRTAAWIYGHAQRSFPRLFGRLSKKALASLQEARTVRVLKAMEESLQYYAETVLPPGLASAPLAFVRERMVLAARNGRAPEGTVDEVLHSLLKRYPQWSECWMELGHLRSDQGRSAEALRFYERAATAGSRTDVAELGFKSPQAISLTAKARVLVRAGRLSDAAKVYAESLLFDPAQPLASIEYGNLLRRLGRGSAAIPFFAAGVSYEESKWCVPQVSRDASTIRFRELK